MGAGQSTDNGKITMLKLGIRTINLRKEVFDVHPDPLSLFPGRIDSHEEESNTSRVSPSKPLGSISYWHRQLFYPLSLRSFLFQADKHQ
jgi:hypothetical protein